MRYCIIPCAVIALVMAVSFILQPVCQPAVYADEAVISISGLEQTYTGLAHAVTVTTNPPDLAVRVTYNELPEPPVNAGSYTVYAEITDLNYTGSTTGTLIISQAWLDIRADLLSRPYGAPNPDLTYTISGYVSSDGPEAVQGNPMLICDATPTSSVGMYTIEVQQGNLTAENYQFRLENNKLYITLANTTTRVVASPNPTGAGQPVMLTAKVTSEVGALPAGVEFGGDVLFSIDGSTPVPVPLAADGTAVYQVAAGSPGMYDISVHYQGDDRFKGSTAGPLRLIIEWLRMFLPAVKRQ